MKSPEDKLLEAVYAPTPEIWREAITLDNKFYNKVELEPKDHVLCITQHTEEGDGEVYLTISQLTDILSAAAKYYEEHD